MTQAVDFEQMWRDLAPIGRSASSGGYFRQPWHAAELELRAWFREAATARGLEIEEDPFGNLVAWWTHGGSAAVDPRLGGFASMDPRGSASQTTRGSAPQTTRGSAPQTPRSDPPAVLTGSHLDSVLDGGAYDGPLGVVSWRRRAPASAGPAPAPGSPSVPRRGPTPRS